MPPPTTDTDKQASLTTLHLASIPGLYSHLHLHTPPFQVPLDRWKALGGRVQDLREQKISARECDLTDRSSKRLPKRQAKKSPDRCQGFLVSAAG